MSRDRQRGPDDVDRQRQQPEFSMAGQAIESGPPPMGQAPAPSQGQQPSSAQPSMPPQQQSRTEIGGGKPTAAIPMADIVESPDEVVVYVDLPGFEEDQIDIHADANNIYVTADRSDDPVYDADEGETALLAERPERLERRISLPSHIDPEEATATNEDGVCRIAVQKEEQERRHEIGFQ